MTQNEASQKKKKKSESQSNSTLPSEPILPAQLTFQIE